MHVFARAAIAAAYLTLAIPASAQGNDDGAINAVYDGIAAAKARNDAAGIADAFAPEALVIDSDLLAASPVTMTRSGLGDLLSTYTAAAVVKDTPAGTMPAMQCTCRQSSAAA